MEIFGVLPADDDLWSKELPNRPGVWWSRCGDNEPILVEVVDDEGQLLMQKQTGSRMLLRYLSGLDWQPAIAEPVDDPPL